ncbi:MAG: HNH endonuclease [Fibrobacterota bacterium]|nr:MAG: HNH endonuclease [Fibrobacterota bacterium]
MNDVNFELERVSGQPISDEDLIADLIRCANLLSTKNLSQKKYAEFGRFEYSTIIRRFGSWNAALAMASLDISNEINIPDEKLYENLLILWMHYGRQPRRIELATSPSTISQTPYNRRFGSWTAALECFVKYANSANIISPTQITEIESEDFRHTTGRDPSLRLRWKVLKRDNFKCCVCGKSPATNPTLELHVDHILPWSKGGETILGNLQTLCSKCNLGKSNTV